MRKIVKKEKTLISQGFQKRRTPLFDKIIRKAESVQSIDGKMLVIEPTGSLRDPYTNEKHHP